MAEEIATFEDAKVRKLLADLEKNLGKINKKDSDFVALMGALVFEDIQRHFEQERGPQGQWAAWSDSYVRSINLRKGPKPQRILQDTGRLRQSFLPSNVRKINGGLLWFNNAKTKTGFPYAAAHNIGGSKLPKRQFMWLSSEAITKMEEQILAFLLNDNIAG